MAASLRTPMAASPRTPTSAPSSADTMLTWASSADSSPQTPAYGPSQVMSRWTPPNANDSGDGSELSSPLMPRDLFSLSPQREEWPPRHSWRWSSRQRYLFGTIIARRPSPEPRGNTSTTTSALGGGGFVTYVAQQLLMYIIAQSALRSCNYSSAAV
jgi:hypothetical protein